MITFKCKMCGGDLALTTEDNVCECEFCGTRQTVPSADSEKKASLFNRANRLRMNAEFDKAAAIYEGIVAEFPEEAEAYWGLCLCTYGIEYVDDPVTGEKKPTCHRTLPTSIMEEENFEQACDCSDGIARRVYREEAKAIDRIQKDILAIVSSEKPYDVFICYKETAEDGSRTEDSVLAQDIYDALTAKGLKVFFARITLEDKLGQQYEPYIYAALSSAKVMLAVGTQFEHYDAVWVKNEWMRYLAMMRTDKSKMLIPCYKDLDAYDMPKEFRQLQAQDMGKLGWLQDLTRGVMKLCGKDQTAPSSAPAVRQAVSSNPTVNSLLQRAQLFLEDGKYEDADQYAERVLDAEPTNVDAYVIKLMISLKVKRKDELSGLKETFEGNEYYQKALRFAAENQRVEIEGWNQAILERQEQERREEEKRQEELASICKKLSQQNEQQRVAREKVKQMRETIERNQIQKQEFERRKARVQKLNMESAEIQQQIERDKSRRMELQSEISQLRGLFTGSKRKQLEQALSEVGESIRYKEERISHLNEQMAAEMRTVADGQLEVDENEAHYTIAMTLYEAGLYLEALEEFKQIIGYKDVDSRLQGDTYLKEAITRTETYAVGKIIKFGRYPQTSSGEDQTPVEWIVLARDGSNALLISRYGLDVKPYNQDRGDITWEDCSLRVWLDETFYNRAFNSAEQLTIIPTDVDNSKSQGYSGYDGNGGNNTQDKVFLLSYNEARTYFDSDKARMCAPTDYAVKQGAYTSSSNKVDGKATGWWCLRSPGSGQITAASVTYDGSRSWGDVRYDSDMIRPALWINLDSGIF